MPRNTLNSQGMNTGSNYQFGDKMIAPNFPRSAFDWSNTLTRDIQQAGQVVPIFTAETLPASDYTISVNSLIRVLPQVVPLMSKQRVYLYAFYSRCSDLWDKFQTFITKGYSGNEILFNPKEVRTKGLTDSQLDNIATNPIYKTASQADKLTVHEHSMGDYLDLPLGVPVSDTDLSLAMYEMMYLRVWRDYFCNRNYYYDDKRILPDDDSRFRLVGSAGELASDGTGSAGYCNVGSFQDEDDCLLYFDKYGLFSAGFDSSSTDWVASKGMQYIDLSSSISVSGKSYDKLFVVAPFYHDYPDDYFVSALPWAQRGDTSVRNGTALNMATGLEFKDGSLSYDTAVTLDTLVKGSFQNIAPSPDVSPSVLSGLGYQFKYGDPIGVLRAGLYTNSTAVYDGSAHHWESRANNPSGQYGGNSVILDTFNTNFGDWLKANVVKASVNGSIGVAENSDNFLTLEKLRELAVNQTIQEKMARTDGSYGEFGLTFYGERSKSAVDFRPTFIGGSTHNVIFTEVLQTSESTTSSPLGTYAGHGISANNDGFLGRFHSDDYGILMIMACIMPDVYYSQGLQRQYTRSLQSEWFLPERAQLGMRPILNRELYLQPSSVVDSDNVEVNTKLWAYQDIFDEYRYKPNRIGGQLAMSARKSFYPYTQARKFTSLENWGKEFARASDVRTDYLSSKKESPYIATFDINIRCVEPLNYRARPAPLVAM